MPRPPRDPWFLLPVTIAMLLDAGVTLAMQPAAYWRDPANLIEGNATWALLLRHGPALFIAGFAVYLSAMAALLLWLRGALQKFLGMFILLAHHYGAASWVHTSEDASSFWWLLMVLFLVEALAFAIYWTKRADSARA